MTIVNTSLGVICFPPSKRGVAKVERQTVTVVARDQRRAASPERKVHRNWSLPHVRRPRGGPHQVGARDTSYPTVLQFHGGIDGDVYRRWLNALPETHRSRYVQVPLCDRAGWLRSGRYRCHEMRLRHQFRRSLPSARHGSAEVVLTACRRHSAIAVEKAMTRDPPARPAGYQNCSAGDSKVIGGGTIASPLSLRWRKDKEDF